MTQDQHIRLIMLRPSRVFAAIFSLAVVTTVVGIVVLNGAGIVAFLLCAGAIVLYGWHMRRLLLWAPDSIVGFALYESKEESVQKLLLKQYDGGLYEARVLPHSFVTSWMTCIKYRRCDGKWIKHFPRTLLLMADSLDAEAFRRVRVQLKWG